MRIKYNRWKGDNNLGDASSKVYPFSSSESFFLHSTIYPQRENPLSQ